MSCGNRYIATASALLLSFILTVGMNSTGWGGEDKERQDLLKKQEALTKKIETLKREQDYLLFLKTVSSADSKYLVFTLSSRTGQLKYKNRILRDFSFSIRGKSRLKQGAVTLTGKKEPTTGRKELIFGNSLILQREGFKIRGDILIPRLFLTKKDFRAIYYALEEGSRVYVIR